MSHSRQGPALVLSHAGCRLQTQLQLPRQRPSATRGGNNEELVQLSFSTMQKANRIYAIRPASSFSKRTAKVLWCIALSLPPELIQRAGDAPSICIGRPKRQRYICILFIASNLRYLHESISMSGNRSHFENDRDDCYLFNARMTCNGIAFKFSRSRTRSSSPIMRFT
jgi:hypothetical protein